MSNFRARFVAELDTKKIDSDIKKINKKKVSLENVTLNTSGLSAKIQSALDKHQFTLNLTNVKVDNLSNKITGSVRSAAQSAGTTFSREFINKINSSVNASSIDKAISAVRNKFSKLNSNINMLGGTGALSSESHSKYLQIEQDLKRINILQTQLSTANSSSYNRPAAYEYLNQVLKRVQNNLNMVTNETRRFASATAVATLNNRMETWLSNNSRASKVYGGEIKSLISRLRELSAQGNVEEAELKRLAADFTLVKSSAQAAGLTGKTFGDSLKGAFLSISRYISASTLIYTAIRAVKNGISDVVALDTALVDLRKTTDATESELKQFYYTSNDVAKQLGVTTQEVISAAAEWSRLGYSIKDAETMAQVSSIFKSISPGMDMTEATDGLVSAMKAFDIEANQALDGIASKINAVGNSQAVSNKDIVEFLTRSSSAMKEANNTLEETVALGTAATEITRDAASVGNALKTVSMRIRGYDETTEEYTGDVEVLNGKIADLTRTAKQPGGVSLFSDKDKTTFKSTAELLRDISEIYNDLTDRQQAGLLEKLAGKRQGQIVAAILNNFDAVESSLTTMKNSAGNAMKEMEIIEQSASYKLNALKETAVGTFQNLFETNEMKAVIDLLTTLLNVIDKLTEHLGLFGVLLPAIGITAFVKNFDRLVALGIKGSKSFDLVVKATARMKDETLAATLAETGLTQEEQARILVMRGYTATEAEATVAMANNTVSTAANTAAQEANAVAGATDTAVDEANTATTVADTTATIANTEATVANTAAQEANAVAGTTSSATNAGGAGGSLIGLAGKGLLGKIGSLFAGFGTSMGATLGVAGIAVGAAVAIGSGIRSYLDKQKEEAEAAIKKQAEDAKNALDTNFSNIRSFQQEMSEVEGQITSIREKILKINQTDKLTIADKSEIDRLATQNQLLEQRLKLLKSSITYEKQQAAASAKKVLESQTQEEFDYFYTQPVDKSPTKQSEKLSDYKTALETQISELQSFYDRYSDVLDYNSGVQNPGSLRAGDATPSALNNIANNIQLQQGAAITAIDKVQSIISSFLDDDGNIIKGYEDLYNVYNQYLNELRLLASPDDILETLESVGISNDVYNALMNQAYTGNFDISKIDDSIIKQFTDKGISEETIEKIFNYKASQYNYLLSEIDKKYAQSYDSSKGNVVDLANRISIKYNPNAKQQVMDSEGVHTEELPQEVKQKNQKVQQLLQKYAKDHPVEFQLLAKYDPNLNSLDEYLEEEYAKTNDWSKAFSSAMAKIQSEAKSMDLEDSTNAKINSKLKKYAKDNPVEFELLLSYDEDFTEFDKYIKQQISNGEDLDTAFTNATKHFSELAKQSKYEEENIGGSMFSNIFNDDGADSFYKKIEKYESSLKKLLDYYNKIASGDFKDSDFAALWKDFPALAGETKNLDSAILSLINTMNINVDADFAAQLEEMKSKGATEQDIAQFQAFHDKVLSASQALTDFAHNANVAISKLENTENAFKAVKSAIDEYNDQNSFSFSTLKSLLELDDEHISLLFNEQGALDLSTQKYKDYTKAQIASLKAAILTDSLNQVENIKTKAAALEYLASSAHNAATSELELADAQWREALIRAHNKDQEVGGDAFTKATQQAYKSYQQRISLIDAYEKSLDQISESTSSAKDASKEYKNQLEAEKHALESTKKALEDKRDALEKQKDGYEEALSSLKDLISLTEEYIRKMKDDEREALEKQKSAYDEIVSKKKEALRLAREEKKVNDEIAEKQKAVAKDALSLSIANLDDSSAGKKSQKTAQDNLVKSNEELQNQLADKEYETRIAALEKEQEAQDKLYDDQIKKIDEYLKNTRKIYEDACAMIDSDTGTLYSNLWNNYVYPYTTQTRAEYNHMWNSAQTALQQYGSAHQGIFALMNNLQENIYKSDDAIKAVKDTISNYATQIDNVTSKINEVGDAADTTIKKVQAAIQAANNIPDIDAGKTWRFSFDGIDYWVDGHKSKYEAANEIINGYLYPKYGAFAVNNPYSNGGKKVPGKGANYSLAQLVHDTIRKYAGGTRNSSSLAITQENGLEAIFGKLSQGQYTMMPQGSQVFNAGMTDNLWKFSSDPQKFISDVIGKMSSFLSSSYGNFADSARGVTNKVTKYGGDVTLSSAPVYHIYGNVDKNTLSTMDKQERQRYELFKKQFMLEMLREKNNL